MRVEQYRPFRINEFTAVRHDEIPAYGAGCSVVTWRQIVEEPSVIRPAGMAVDPRFPQIFRCHEMICCSGLYRVHVIRSEWRGFFECFWPHAKHSWPGTC